jgi:NADH:ubiquinone oxidoreductase subunit K
MPYYYETKICMNGFVPSKIIVLLLALNIMLNAMNIRIKMITYNEFYA